MAIHVDYVLSLTDLPADCISDCSAQGKNDEAVLYWRKRLDFTVNRYKAIACLIGYGAWEPDDLAAMDDAEIAEKVLWLACGNFGEYVTECERHNPPIDPRGDRPDDFDPSSGSDIFALE